MYNMCDQEARRTKSTHHSSRAVAVGTSDWDGPLAGATKGAQSQANSGHSKSSPDRPCGLTQNISTKAVPLKTLMQPWPVAGS